MMTIMRVMVVVGEGVSEVDGLKLLWERGKTGGAVYSERKREREKQE